MALLHQAELKPSKLELLAGWISSQPWFDGDESAALTSVGAFRFDDPEGEVGVETLLVRAGDGPLLQVPLTYRGAPLEGADAALIGTMEHSVLGPRWAYDGLGDPVYLLTVATAAAQGGHQAELVLEVNGKQEQRTPTALVEGDGSSATAPSLPVTGDITTGNEGVRSIAATGRLQVVVNRVVDATDTTAPRSDPFGEAASRGTLFGKWEGQAEPRALVFVAYVTD